VTPIRAFMRIPYKQKAAREVRAAFNAQMAARIHSRTATNGFENVERSPTRQPPEAARSRRNNTRTAPHLEGDSSASQSLYFLVLESAAVRPILRRSANGGSHECSWLFWFPPCDSRRPGVRCRGGNGAGAGTWHDSVSDI